MEQGRRVREDQMMAEEEPKIIKNPWNRSLEPVPRNRARGPLLEVAPRPVLGTLSVEPASAGHPWGPPLQDNPGPKTWHKHIEYTTGEQALGANTWDQCQEPWSKHLVQTPLSNYKNRRRLAKGAVALLMTTLLTCVKLADEDVNAASIASS